MPRRPNVFDDNFVDKKTIPVTESGCLLWLGSTVTGGYGKTYKAGKTVLAHRAIWEHKYGPIPEGQVVCHRCDNPLCVNVNHLFLGTRLDNSRDMVAKGREAKGVSVNNAKLTEEQVIEIRETSGTLKALGDHYGVHYGTIRQIKNRETWRHLP